MMLGAPLLSWGCFSAHVYSWAVLGWPLR